jgi:hypothetical protein
MSSIESNRDAFFHLQDLESSLWYTPKMKDGRPPLDKIKSFIDQAVTSSPLIEDVEDRSTIRRHLRFWASYLLRNDEPYPDIDFDRPERRPKQLSSRNEPVTVTRDNCIFDILYASPELSKEELGKCFGDYDTSQLMSIRKIILLKTCHVRSRVPYASVDVVIDSDDIIYVTVLAPDGNAGTRCVGLVKIYPKEK